MSIQYLCRQCSSSFTVNYSHNKISSKDFTNLHLDGVSFRKVGKRIGSSGVAIFKRTQEYFRKLTTNMELTIKYADMYKYSGYLVVDGTYIAVKGHPRKLVLIWGIDYLTHDVPHYIIGGAENYQTMLAYFKRLELLEYNLRYLVCDDNEAIKMVAIKIYPRVIIQTCLKHYRESIRRDLGLKTSNCYLGFYLEIDKLFTKRLCNVEVAWAVQKLYPRFKNDPRCVNWLTDIMQRKDELTNYHMFENTPNTTNLIEAYNSHLKGRLKTIKGFKSLTSMKLWVNAYIVKRRLSDFTSCDTKFKHLNGMCSLKKVLKSDQKLPQLF